MDQQNTQTTEHEIAKDSIIEISSTISENAKWYVVHTYSGHEKKVALTLKQRAEALGHLDKIFKVMIPTQEKIVVSEGKKRKVDERIYPGYILVQMDMNDDVWYIVRSTRGVTGFVGTGNNPTPLAEAEVKALMKVMTMDTPKFEAKFSVGDSVKIVEGPFNDFLGKVDEVNEEQGKLKVLVSVFGRETPVELDFTQVKSL
jgi:transcriptional antiterminator NusG